MDCNVYIELILKVVEWLVDKGYDDKMGVCLLGCVIQEYIKKLFVEELFFGKLVKGGLVKVIVKVGELYLKFDGLEKLCIVGDKLLFLMVE